MSRSQLLAILRNSTGRRIALAAVAWTALCCLLSPSRGQAGDMVDDPYLVFVASESAYLRCGPAGEYYRTDPLRHGQELEVYVETKDGWLGVRPIKQSFCWVVADAIDAIDSDSASDIRSDFAVSRKGRVTEDRTVAWIGTNLGRARRYRWQVQLARGESVTILGSSEREGADGPQTWYRIVPPSGEFRWIHRDQVVTTAEELVASLKPQPREAKNELEFLPADVPSEGTRLADVDANRLWRKQTKRGSGTDARTVQQTQNDEQSLSRIDELKNLSQRISEGLSVLIGGQEEMPELEPVTLSSRRIPDLVPKDVPTGRSSPETSQIVSASTAGSQVDLSPSAASVPFNERPDRIIGSGLSQNALPMQSELSIASRPRVVPEEPISGSGSWDTPRNERSWNQPGSPIRQVGSTDISMANAPAIDVPSGHLLRSTRTISSAEIEEVQRQIAATDSSDLSVLLSKMMARAASAPEIGLVAEAAERAGDTQLAARARQYQTISRRRDGDTMVQTASLSTPVRPIPMIPNAMTDGAHPHEQAETAAPELPSTESRPVHEGTIVEVYSADPHRPPFALTDQGGRTIAYVTPAPGLDLRTFLGGPVRVVGETGYLRKLRTPHILATEVQR